MSKRGRKLAGATPKRNYGTKLSADVLAIIRAQPNQAEFLERIVREWDSGMEKMTESVTHAGYVIP